MTDDSLLLKVCEGDNSGRAYTAVYLTCIESKADCNNPNTEVDNGTAKSCDACNKTIAATRHVPDSCLRVILCLW